MSPDTPSSALLGLPGEIKNKIISHMEPLDVLMMRSTCRYFRNIIPPFNMDELLVAEASEMGRQRNLYACCRCLRLRDASEFADSMRKGSKRKTPSARSRRHARFCLDCGLNPPPGQPGYGPGAIIVRNGAACVKCIFCLELAPFSKYGNGTNSQCCTRCWPMSPQAREMHRQLLREQDQREQERRQRQRDELEEREEREQLRGKMGEISGLDAEDTVSLLA